MKNPLVVGLWAYGPVALQMDVVAHLGPNFMPYIKDDIDRVSQKEGRFLVYKDIFSLV